MAIMHKVALLRARVTKLESANERLSKRRRLKKKRLQARGSLSVQEAEDIIDGSNGGGDLGGDLGGNGPREGSNYSLCDNVVNVESLAIIRALVKAIKSLLLILVLQY